MNHVKYSSLVKARGVKAAYVQYKDDGGTLFPIEFERKYS